jgi:hypothetical protein
MEMTFILIVGVCEAHREKREKAVYFIEKRKNINNDGFIFAGKRIWYSKQIN